MYLCQRCQKQEVRELGEKCKFCRQGTPIESIPVGDNLSALRSDPKLRPTTELYEEMKERAKTIQIRQAKRHGSQFNTPTTSRQNTPAHSRQPSRSQTPELIQFSRSTSPENQKQFRKQVDETYDIPEFSTLNQSPATDAGSYVGIAVPYQITDEQESLSGSFLDDSQILSQFPTKEDTAKTLNINKNDQLGEISQLFQQITKENNGESPIDPNDENYVSPSVSPLLNVPQQYKRLSFTSDAFSVITNEINEEIASSPLEDSKEFNYSEEIIKRVNNLGEQQLETIIEEEEGPENETENQEDYRQIIDVVLEGEENKRKLVRRKVNVKKFAEKTGKKIIEIGSRVADVALSETTQNIAKVVLAPIPGGSVVADFTIGGLRQAKQTIGEIQQKKRDLLATKNLLTENEEEFFDVDEAEKLTTEHAEQEQNYFLKVNQKLDELLNRRNSANEKFKQSVDIMENQVDFSAQINQISKDIGVVNTTQKNLVEAITKMGEGIKTQSDEFEKKLTTDINTSLNSLNFSTQLTQLKTDLTKNLKPQSPQSQNNNGLMIVIAIGFIANLALGILNYFKKSPEVQPPTA
ncbi:4621_t:CDS:1 [Racocetra persica]|uniref:4621_t:CDS:1 n=1 Tax=Racocetra persica TaxID=160502 RepID=A0ACA9LRE8_9GLOM|nr:4621_t:CDS:1 [Racocetra persica]